MTREGPGVTRYEDAGVHIDAADELNRRLGALVASTRTAESSGEFGSFGGRFRVPAATELVSSADGVGTKVLVASAAGRHDTVGEDLVNHCVNDILAEGAEPLFFLDYYACGRLDPDVAEAVISGVARGCRRNGCALVGGETAEMPGVYGRDHYDLAGFIVGRRTWDLPGRTGVRPGMRLVGLPSSGLHTNGYSLARRLLFDELGLGPSDPFPGGDESPGGPSVADVLLRVHRSYLAPLRPALDAGAVVAMAHITGGGVAGNLERILPAGTGAVVDVDTWDPPAEFVELARLSRLDRDPLYEVWNMGVGMILAVDPGRVDEVRELVAAGGSDTFPCGEVDAGDGVRLVGG